MQIDEIAGYLQRGYLPGTIFQNLVSGCKQRAVIRPTSLGYKVVARGPESFILRKIDLEKVRAEQPGIGRVERATFCLSP